nr:cobyric acid synthase [Diplocloster agilis]
MIQGTMSNAGKSLLTAGLLRVFAQDGYRVAPFKSQNMALNSYITAEGLEMGRAQVVQAEAAGVEPSVRMNPILLKPVSDVGSQVIVCGEVRGNMSAAEYFRYKQKLAPVIMEAYRELEKDRDIIVIEGAGSPAEINLKNHDIVNMGLAEMVDAPVLLAGDIDRGGVFAQLYGTVELLDPQERERIKGLIINKFRGDRGILEPGIAMLEEKCRLPVVGVMPWINVDIEDEDSLTERFHRKSRAGEVKAAVIRLPHISNFTDFNPLETVEGLEVAYVSSVKELGDPDLILLPGTKNTMGDLKWLRQNGLEAAVLKCAAKGVPVFGICGGYQMMGEKLSDPCKVESGGQMQGMGLLPVQTVFEERKVRTRVHGTVSGLAGFYQGLSGSSFSGYEIHMGTSEITGPEASKAGGAGWKTDGGEYGEDSGRASGFSRIQMSAGGQPGAETNGLEAKDLNVKELNVKEDGCVYKNAAGTYVHGIFENNEFAEQFLRLIYRRKGLSFEDRGRVDIEEYKRRQYDRLADAVRENLDMKEIYRMIGL